MGRIICNNKEYKLNIRCKNVLEAIQEAGLALQASCGGNSSCKKCGVWVKSVHGLERKLACELVPCEEMTIYIDALEDADIVTSGVYSDAFEEEMGEEISGGCGAQSNCEAGYLENTAARRCVENAIDAGVRKDATRNMTGSSHHRALQKCDSVKNVPTCCVDAVDADQYGLVFDVGTTTLVARLCTLDKPYRVFSLGKINPQISFGADVVSRIQASMCGQTAEMHACLWSALNDAMRTLVLKADVDLSAIKQIVVTGNTVMECIAANVSPYSLGKSPFVSPTRFGYSKSTDLCCVDTDIYFAPCISGFVGADVVSDILFCSNLIHAKTGEKRAKKESNKKNNVQLLLDLGTNGEIALITTRCAELQEKLQHVLCCATAAGPVFEGGAIEHGMPALPGAINHVSLKNGTLKVHTIKNAKPFGICGSGLIEACALLLETGVIDESGKMCAPTQMLDNVSKALVARIEESENGLRFKLADEVFITQHDIRALQLAISALSAGIKTLLKQAKLNIDDVDQLFIAGGFGTHLSIDAAVRCGLIPRQLAHKTRCVGNSAIEGASMQLYSQKHKHKAQDIAKRSEYIELSGHPDFETFYIESLNFPNLKEGLVHHNA